MKTNLIIGLPARKGVPGSLVDVVKAVVREWHEEHDSRFANFVTMDVALVPESDADRVEADRIAGREQRKPETFHIGLSLQSTEPLPVTFYLSPEILAPDSGVSDEDIARLLLRYLTIAVKHHREALNQPELQEEQATR